MHECNKQEEIEKYTTEIPRPQSEKSLKIFIPNINCFDVWQHTNTVQKVEIDLVY